MGTDSVLRQMRPAGSVRRSTWENRSKASQAEEFGAEGATAPETLRPKGPCARNYSGEGPARPGRRRDNDLRRRDRGGIKACRRSLCKTLDAGCQTTRWHVV